MTVEEVELEILNGIDRRDVQTFLPAGLGAAEVQHFNELIERLQDMKRLGWIELEIAEKRSRVLRLLGE